MLRFLPLQCGWSFKWQVFYQFCIQCTWDYGPTTGGGNGSVIERALTQLWVKMLPWLQVCDFDLCDKCFDCGQDHWSDVHRSFGNDRIPSSSPQSHLLFRKASLATVLNHVLKPRNSPFGSQVQWFFTCHNRCCCSGFPWVSMGFPGALRLVLVSKLTRRQREEVSKLGVWRWTIRSSQATGIRVVWKTSPWRKGWIQTKKTPWTNSPRLSSKGPTLRQFSTLASKPCYEIL